MAIKRQSIRKNMYILVDGKEISKDALIQISEEWSEIQENFFRKMLKQQTSYSPTITRRKNFLI